MIDNSVPGPAGRVYRVAAVPSHRDIVTCCIFAVEELFGVVPKSRHPQKLSMEKAWNTTPGKEVNDRVAHEDTEE